MMNTTENQIGNHSMPRIKTTKNCTDRNPIDKFSCEVCGFNMDGWSAYKLNNGSRMEYDFALEYCPKCGLMVVNDGRRSSLYETRTVGYKEGDKIQVGKYTATCVKVDGKDCIFLLDQYLDTVFTHQNLISELNGHLLEDKNFKEINAIAKPYIYCDGPAVLYRVPFAGEMFSGTEKDAWIKKYCAPDTPDGFLDIWECMKDPKSRIAFSSNYICSYWLMNGINGSEVERSNIGEHGICYRDVTNNFKKSVRPVFVIENKPQNNSYEEINEDDITYVLNRVQDALDDTQYEVFGYGIAKGIFLKVMVSKK